MITDYFPLTVAQPNISSSNITAAVMVTTTNNPLVSEDELKRRICISTWIAYLEEPDIHFITGINCTAQIWAAEELIKLTESEEDCSLSIICSYPRMENEWDGKMRKRIKRILAKADEIVYLANKPNKRSFELCNEWLLKHSDMLIPIYIGNKEQYDKIIQMAINTEHGYTG